MNVGGGEAADQMVRMLLSGTEVTVRLTGLALKNLLALSWPWPGTTSRSPERSIWGKCSGRPETCASSP